MPGVKTEGILVGFDPSGQYKSGQMVGLGDLGKTLRPGDIVFLSSVTAIGLLIKKGQQGVLPPGTWTPTHVEIVVDVDPILGPITRSSEPIGYVPRFFNRLFCVGNRVEVWRPQDLTPGQIDCIMRASWVRSIKQEGYGWLEFLSTKLPFVKAPAGDNRWICSAAVSLDYDDGGVPLFKDVDLEKVKPADLYKRVTDTIRRPKFSLHAII